MFKLLKKLKYAVLSKIAERKLKRKYGCIASVKIKVIKVQQSDGKMVDQIKTEITSYEKDYKKLIDVLLMKSC